MTQVNDHRGRAAGLTGRDGPAAPRSRGPGLEPIRSAAGVAGVIEALLGGDLPIAVTCYDGSRAGPGRHRRRRR